MRAFAFDRDGTLEWGDPPGPITREHLERTRALGYAIGGSGGQAPEEQERNWQEKGIEPDFLVHKANLPSLGGRFTELTHVGDAEDDLNWARKAGARYITPQGFLDWLDEQGEQEMLAVTMGDWKYPILLREKFPPEMPRYPNLWFYVSQDLAAAYDDAVSNVLGILEKCGLYGITWRAPLEGADGEAARDHLAPYDGFSTPLLFHEHSLHLRYYLNALRDKSLKVRGDRTYLCWAIAASVHFEPGGRAHYLSLEEYPELQTCPFCGRIDESVAIAEIYEKIRDPLGLELILEGRLRGGKARDAFGRTVQGLKDVGVEGGRLRIRTTDVSGDFPKINTARLGFVLVA